MSRWCRWPRVSRALAALWLGLWLALALPAQANAADPATDAAGPLVLAPIVDGVATGEPIVVRRVSGRVFVRMADLRALGVVAATGAKQEVALDTVAGLTARIDDRAQTIALTLPPTGRRRISLSRPAPSHEAATPNGWGMAINYDLSAGAAPGYRRAGGAFDAVAFTPRGYAFAGVVATIGDGAGRYDARGRASRLIRLDTGYTLTDPRRLLRATVGDVVTTATGFATPVRLGGAKLGTDFGLRPDLVTFPLPAIRGSAAVPSSVDLIVGGSRRAVGDVRAGDFAVADVPVVNGVNSVGVAVRDTLGRTTLRTVTTYASRTLLRPGLTAWSVEAGRVRTGYASDRDRYRGAAISGSVRHGLTRRLTVDAHGEGQQGFALAGAGIAWTPGALGLLDLGVAASRGRDRTGPPGSGSGVQLGAGFERIGGPVSLTARYVRSSAGFVDLSRRYGEANRRHSAILNLGFDLRRAGTLSVGLIDLGSGVVRPPVDRDGPGIGNTDRRGFVVPATRLLTASYYARPARRLSLIANLGVDLRERRSLFASIGLLATSGGRRNAYVGATVRRDAIGAVAQASQIAAAPGQFGYQASVTTGGVERIVGGVEYQGTRGHVDAQVERTGGESAVRASARGSLLLIGGQLRAADTTTQSFALVETAGRGGVTVYRDNRPVGVTDRGGRLLVPHLNANQPTRLTLDPTELANDVHVDTVERIVRPMEHVGVAVRFDLSDTRAIQVRLVAPRGVPLLAGARATVAGEVLPVGLDGLLYLTRAKGRTAIEVALPAGGQCRAMFDAPTRVTPGMIVGPVSCLGGPDPPAAPVTLAALPAEP